MRIAARKTRQVGKLTLGMLMRIAARKTRQVARLILVRPPPTWDCLKVWGWHTATYLRAANSGKHILANQENEFKCTLNIRLEEERTLNS